MIDDDEPVSPAEQDRSSRRSLITRRNASEASLCSQSTTVEASALGFASELWDSKELSISRWAERFLIESLEQIAFLVHDLDEMDERIRFRYRSVLVTALETLPTGLTIRVSKGTVKALARFARSTPFLSELITQKIWASI